jgi:DNA (cytosine-5)-methyltransferase 1
MTKQPTFIDLFCGCGGWTEGFSQLGYKCLYSVDFWTPAAIAHSINHPGIEDDDKAKNILDGDVAETVKSKLRSGEVDILIGSPPCTQFSFSNRGGGGNTVEGMVLVRRFLEFVDFVQNDLMLDDFPWVMENVPRLKLFLEKECVDVKKNTFRLNYVDEPETFYEVKIPKVVVLNSADYGAPQRRRRVFCGNFSIPKPTHVSSEIKNDPVKKSEFIKNYEITEAEFKKLKPWRTLDDILQALPNPMSKPIGAKTLVDPNYPELEINTTQLHDHFYDTRLRPGIELFESHMMKQHHPVYGVMNFPDDETQPARTVMATEMVVSRETIIVPVNRGYIPRTLGKRPYAEILTEHKRKKCGGYRRLTVRELACVQGFPITYQLSGKSSSIKHKQIGNAVSPFISRAFGRMFAKQYLNQPTIADAEDEKLILNRPESITDYDSHEHTKTWKTKPYKKNSQKFYGHLRTTKADGQRLDLAIVPADKETWKSILCLGSGKSYRRTEIDENLIGELLSGLKAGQNRINGELDEWISRIEDEINRTDSSQILSSSLAENFNDNGSLAKGTPIYFVEEGIDSIIRNAVNGRYDELAEIEIDVGFSEFNISRPINAYTVIAAIALEKLVKQVNS